MPPESIVKDAIQAAGVEVDKEAATAPTESVMDALARSLRRMPEEMLEAAYVVLDPNLPVSVRNEAWRPLLDLQGFADSPDGASGLLAGMVLMIPGLQLTPDGSLEGVTAPAEIRDLISQQIAEARGSALAK